MDRALLKSYLPDAELRRLGLRVESLLYIEVLKQTAAHIVCRLKLPSRSYIAKAYRQDADPFEIKVYALLKSLRIPVLFFYNRTRRAILLEDLQSSPSWCTAADDDMVRPEVGAAVGQWYRCLHKAGSTYLQKTAKSRVFLRCWVDEIEPAAYRMAGQKFGINNSPAWESTLQKLDLLKARYKAFPQTINYNDFAAENLAITRAGNPLQAIVYDYDCLRTGTVYSDLRNVLYALEGPAKTAFLETYGPYNPDEEIYDEILSTLYGLVIAAIRETTPGWAPPLIEMIKGGQFARWVERALME